VKAKGADGNYKTVKTTWVKSSGDWRQVGVVSAREGGSWRSEGVITPGTPGLSVVTPTNPADFGRPPLLTLIPAQTGGATKQYRLEEYRYNSSGGNKTLASVTTGTWSGGMNVRVESATPPPEGSKVSYDLYAVGFDGITVSPPASVRWQLGTSAVTQEQAVYNWVASGYQRPTLNYFNTPDISLAAYKDANGVEQSKSFAYDDSTTSYYLSDAIGKTEVVSWGLVGEIRGNGVAYGSTTANSYRPTITLNWKSGGNASTRRLRGLRVTHRGLVGTYSSAFATFARGTMFWRLENSADYTATQSFEVQCGGDPGASTMTYQTGTREWSALTQPWGQSLILRAHRPAFYVVFGDALSRFSIADIRVNVENYQITGYQTVIITPATNGSSW
jgi:hypothetical protein